LIEHGAILDLSLDDDINGHLIFLRVNWLTGAPACSHLKLAQAQKNGKEEKKTKTG
jgi:hypothetical protein